MAETSLHAICDQARQLLEQNDFERAIAVAQHILEFFPNHLETHRILGEAYLASREFDQAQTAFSQVLNADPENIPALVGMGITYERQGKLDQAVNELEQALEIKPDMAELRSQLLRLYTDAWGSEGAQLRLSRAGLARLYAKGHMLPQAIQEYRSVIAEHPDRFDAQVGLAEVLWRDGQEDVVAYTCDEIINQRDSVLKANLLLGYIKLASGDPNGKHYWEVAQQLDPYQGVARSLFDTLPDVEDPHTTLPDWDETVWQGLKDREEAERRAQEEAIQAPPVEQAAVVAPPEDMFAGSWMDNVETPQLVEASPDMSDESSNDDDFLANLLAFESLDQDELAGVEGTTSATDASAHTELDDLDIDPFSFENIGLDNEGLVPSEPEERQTQADPVDQAAAAPSADPITDDGELQPFSLEDLGLSDEEIAALNSVDEPTSPDHPVPPAVTPPSAAEEAELEPFSLDGLDLDNFDDTTHIEFPQSSTEQGSSDDAANTPPANWSLNISQPDQAASSERPAPDLGENDFLGDLQPFSLDDLDLNVADDTNAYPDLSQGSLPPSLQPFSLGDLGDVAPPAGSAEAEDHGLLFDAETEDDADEPVGFGWQQPTSKPGTDFVREPNAAGDTQDDHSIFAKLKQRRQEIPEEEEVPLPPTTIEEGDEELAFFSEDEISLRDDDEYHNAPPAEVSAATNEEPLLTPFSLDEVDLSEEEIAALNSMDTPGGDQQADAPAANDEELQPFSLGDLGLSEEEIAALNSMDTPGGDQQADAPAANDEELQPFSLEDLGLSEEEIAALNSMNTPGGDQQTDAPATSDEELQPFSLEDLGLSEEEIAALNIDEQMPATSDDQAQPDEQKQDLSAAESSATSEAEPELTPFSLKELGLSDEEIAALNMEELPGDTQPDAVETTPEPETTETSPSDTASQEMLDSDPEPNIAPFSLDDLGVDEPTLDAGEQTSAPKASSGPSEELSDSFGNLQPFSMDDLGLDDELNSFNFEQPGGRGEGELGITEDELAGLELEGFGGRSTGNAPGGTASSLADGDTLETFDGATTGDPVIDQLLQLGHQQGFVDLNDIINVVENPVDQPERIEEIGQALHDAGIQIRDGDEIIDMDEDYEEQENVAAELEDMPAQAADSDDAELMPFSLEDLGLTDEEIEALGLAEVQSETEAADTGVPSEKPAAEQSDSTLAPFSFEDIELSQEELDALNTATMDDQVPAEETQQAEPATSDTSVADEPTLTPFSLEDLGLSEAEIAALNSVTPEQGSSNAETTATDEPTLTPFSLEDLGLSEAEIAALSAAGSPEESGVDKTADDPSDIEEDFDAFDFSIVDEHREEIATPIQRTESPEVVEETSPTSPEDAAFVPEPLTDLDNIWDVPPTEAAPSTSRPEAAAPPEPAPSEVAPPAAIPEPAAPPAVVPAPAPRASRAAANEAPRALHRGKSLERFLPTGDETLDGYIKQVEADADNYGLHLAIARLAVRTHRADLALHQYKHLVKSKELLDEVVDDVQELIEDTEERVLLQRLHRLLGDAYSEQNRFREAIAAYSWTFTKK